MLRIVGCSLLFSLFGVVGFYLIRSVVRMSRRSSAVQKRAKEIMRDRRAMSPLEFGSEFFAGNQAEAASRIYDILKKVLIVDVSRIRPDDRLVQDLGLAQVDGLDPNFLELDIKDSFGVSIRAAWPSIKTVRDLVTYVSTHCPTRA